MLSFLKFIWDFFFLLVKAALFVIVVCVLGQDFLVFPQLLVDPWRHTTRDVHALPAGVESNFFTSGDSKKIEMWRVFPEKDVKPHGVVVLFHGNAGTVDSFLPYYKWFAKRGYITYGLEYRGYGTSGGWPSASGIMDDIDVAMGIISKRENIDPSEILPVGISLGAGFAAYAADKFQTRSTLLVSAYTSLKELASTRPIIGVFWPLLWNEVATRRYIEFAENRCIVAVHGKRDDIIPVAQAEELSRIAPRKDLFRLIVDEKSSHNDVFWNAQERIERELLKCHSARL